MSGHATLSPSRRHRYAKCPGSVREESKYPEKPSGPAAIDGTHDHTLLETVIKAGLGYVSEWIGKTLTDHDGEFQVDAERAERVQFAVNHIASRVAHYGGMCTVKTESKVNPEHLVGRGDMKGTVDIQIHAHLHRVLEIMDYKGGFHPVSAQDNAQMQVYALGALAELKLPVNGQYPFNNIVMTIIQPKMRLKGLEPITSQTLPTSAVLDMIGQMVVEAAATEAPDAPLVAGVEQCRYCRADACTERAKVVFEGIGIMNSDTTMPMFPDLAAPAGMPSFMQPAAPVSQLSAVEQAASKDPSKMDAQEIARIMEMTPLILQLIENVKEEAMRRMKAGGTIPGFKVVKGRGSRSWALPDDEMAEKLIGMGIPKSAVYETVLLSPAKAEKLTWEKKSKGEMVRKQLTERQLKTMEKEYVTQHGGKPTIAHEDDSRPALVFSAENLFASVEPQPAAPSLPDWMK